jgi:hypothetical protein
MNQPIAVNILSNEEDRKKLYKVVRECSDSMTRVQGEKDFLKEAVADVCEELKLPKRIVNRLIKVYHKQNFDEEVAVQDQFETLYEMVVKTK